MPVDVGSGQYSFICTGLDYGSQTSPVIRIPGRVRGGTGVIPLTLAQVNAITGQARMYVARGLAALVPQTTALAADIQGGDLAAAKAAWLTAHLTWERLGSAYGMFGAYDDTINGVPFGLAGSVNDPGFIGFYRLEYGLWHGQSALELAGPASQLAAQVRTLRTAWPGIELPTTQAVGDLALRTHEVLEDAMQNQLSGLDDFGSGTTLATFAAGVDATRAQLAILYPYLVTRYPQTAALYSLAGSAPAPRSTRKRPAAAGRPPATSPPPSGNSWTRRPGRRWNCSRRSHPSSSKKGSSHERTRAEGQRLPTPGPAASRSPGGGRSCVACSAPAPRGRSRGGRGRAGGPRVRRVHFAFVGRGPTAHCRAGRSGGPAARGAVLRCVPGWHPAAAAAADHRTGLRRDRRKPGPSLPTCSRR